MNEIRREPLASGRVPMLERVDTLPQLPDDELERELTIAVAARTASRQRLFDALLDELERRRREQ